MDRQSLAFCIFWLSFPSVLLLFAYLRALLFHYIDWQYKAK